MLTPQQLSDVKAHIMARLGDTGTVLAYSWTSDGMGSGTATYTATGTVACSLGHQRQKRMEGVNADGLGSATDWVIVMPSTTTVALQDRIAVNGQTFEVSDVDTGMSNYAGLVIDAVLVQ